MLVALFPGQGVQRAGMAGDLPERVPEVFATASGALGVDVAALCTQGAAGEASLDSTRWAQPAIVAVGVASWLDAGLDARAACGHSIGEYTALVAAGAVGLADALDLVRLRAEAMDRAGTATPGGMAAVAKLDRDALEPICERTGVALAADNAPGQLVVSGAADALDAAVEAIAEAGGRCTRLEVAGAFHSPVMAAAAGELSEALERTTFTAPAFEVWSPTTTKPVNGAEEIRSALSAQLTGPVRFRETLLGLADRGGEVFIDLGPGKVVANLAKRTVEGAEIRAVGDGSSLGAKGR